MGYPVGIDLGTTNSVVCVWRRGQPETIRVDGQPTLPSALSVLPDGTEIIGRSAKACALAYPERSITSVKRCIGDGTTTWSVGGRTYTPVDVSAAIVRRLKEAAEAHLGAAVREAVITVPAYFNDDQKRDTKLAGERSGVDLRVIQLLPEPTAAAIRHGLDQGADQTILVYDLGGGTFDVSVLRVVGNRFEVVAVDGDFHLGGDDFDIVLAEHLIGRLRDRSRSEKGFLRSLFTGGRGGVEQAAPREMLLARQVLKEAAEEAKKELSESRTARVSLPDVLGSPLEEEVSRAQFEGLIEPLVDRTIRKVDEVLRSAGVTTDEIDRVILVGGSTRCPLVQQRVAEKVKEPYRSGQVDEVVAHGAAIVASAATVPEEDLRRIEIQDVVPFSLGVCSYEPEGRSRYVNSIIIPKNSKVPSSESREYEVRTRAGGDNQLDVHLLQGESREPAECLMKGKYTFSGVAHGPEGKGKVRIEFGYDLSGMITVGARDASSGRELPLTHESPTADLSWLSRPPAGDERFDPSKLRLVATPPGYDDVGNVLRSLGLPFQVWSSSSQSLDCDVFFWNCLAGQHPSPERIREYVRDGGCLYASCMAAQKLEGVFQGAIDFEYTGCRSAHITTSVEDPELSAELGDTLRIEYNTAACYGVRSMGPDGRTLLRDSGSNEQVMVMAPFGKGHVFFTRYHHHRNLSADEKRLLQLLVMKQISVASGIPIEIVTSRIRL